MDDHQRLIAYYVVVATVLRVSELIALRFSGRSTLTGLRVVAGKSCDGRLVPLLPDLQGLQCDYWRAFRSRGTIFERLLGHDPRTAAPGVAAERGLARCLVNVKPCPKKVIQRRKDDRLRRSN